MYVLTRQYTYSSIGFKKRTCVLHDDVIDGSGDKKTGCVIVGGVDDDDILLLIFILVAFNAILNAMVKLANPCSAIAVEPQLGDCLIRLRFICLFVLVFCSCLQPPNIMSLASAAIQLT